MAANLEKIAKMELFGVSQKQIAETSGLTDGRISQIINSDEYKVIKGELETTYIENNQTLNEGWDQLEALALNQLVEVLQWSQDADFALKAAAMANRANRRGNSNQPLDGRVGVRAVIHLQQVFVERLQQVQINQAQTNGEIPQKETNVMTPGDVERSFVDTLTEEIGGLLPPIPENAMVAAE